MRLEQRPDSQDIRVCGYHLAGTPPQHDETLGERTSRKRDHPGA